jgi:hypothetical protein
LPEFRYDRHRSFRAWLRPLLLKEWGDSRRKRHEPPLDAADPAFAGLAVPDGAAEPEEVEYRQALLRRAPEVMQAEFQPTTWKACWEYVVAGRPAAEVAADLGISVGVGAHYSVEGLRSKKLEPRRFPLVLVRKGRILPVRACVCPFDRSRGCSATFAGCATRPCRRTTPCCCSASWRRRIARPLHC